MRSISRAEVCNYLLRCLPARGARKHLYAIGLARKNGRDSLRWETTARGPADRQFHVGYMPGLAERPTEENLHVECSPRLWFPS